MATLYVPGAGARAVQPADGRSFTLTEMHDLIGGDLDFVHLSKDQVLVVDDLGVRKRLPVNRLATALYAHHGGRHPIHGVALLCHLHYPGTERETWD